MTGAVLLNTYCTIFGDADNGARTVLGGLADPNQVDRQWYCPKPYVVRCRMVCDHGHRGQIMKLCQKHFDEFKGSVQFCPACNRDENGHKCNLKLEAVS